MDKSATRKGYRPPSRLLGWRVDAALADRFIELAHRSNLPAVTMLEMLMAQTVAQAGDNGRFKLTLVEREELCES